MKSKLANADLTELPLTYQKIVPKEYIDEMGHLNVAYYTRLFSVLEVKVPTFRY